MGISKACRGQFGRRHRVAATGNSSAADSLKRLLGLHGQTDRDFRGAVEHFEHVIAQEAAELAGRALAAGKLDAPITGTAIRTDDV
jgi:hypothetical protein